MKARGAQHIAPLFRYASAHTDTAYCVSGIQYFDLDQYIDPDSLRIPAEIGQDRRGRNGVSVGLGTNREVDYAISSDSARRGTCIGDDTRIRVTWHTRLQGRRRKASIRV